MKYMLLIRPDPSITVSPEQADPDPWDQEMDRRGVAIMRSRLQPSSASTCVRVREGELTVTDGPFAEAKEVFAGFCIIECLDRDEAIRLASEHPVTKFGAIEIRPFWPFDEG